MEENRGKSGEKKIKIILIIFSIVSILFIILWFAGPTIHYKFAEPEDLELTISSEKELINVTSDESLLVNIELTNVVDTNLFIHYDFSIDGLLEFNITTPSNNTIYPVHTHVEFSEKTIKLHQSESIKTNVDIFNYDYSFDQRDDSSDLYDWNETGKYKIKFEYHNFQSDYEIVESNVIEFEIM